MIGGHFLKGWSRTQNNVTCSSAEAELIALVKCSAELLGMRSAMKDWGVESSGVVYADSSAAHQKANRRGRPGHRLRALRLRRTDAVREAGEAERRNRRRARGTHVSGIDAEIEN